ncbi:MAG: discoidin domain-containing protein [Gemmataceae bacterium]
MRLAKRNCVSYFLLALAVGIGVSIWHRAERKAAAEDSPLAKAWTGSLSTNGKQVWRLQDVKAGHTYVLSASLRSGTLGNDDRISVQLEGPAHTAIHKDLHAGDPDLYTHYRPQSDGDCRLQIQAGEKTSSKIPIEVSFHELPINAEETPAFDPGPNDVKTAAPLILGRSIYGAVDEVDYLDNQDEGKRGLRWYRVDYTDDQPALVYFYLDILDRDVSVNLRMYKADDKTGEVKFYPCKADGSQARYETTVTASGIDPMEIIHDREGNPMRGVEERYSKHISRVLTKGTYYLEVNANHPDYLLRTRKLPVPPYHNGTDAVEAGMQYIMNVGDAWFAQVPREGAIYRRVQNMHDTATRCTACHPSVFSTESNLVAHRFGYPIRSKENLQYVVNRIYNSISPLYGHDGLNYQRFISIPFQAQGKQGGILRDYEAQVTGVESKTFLRFGPFLKTAWAERTNLPPDELNGVVPLDSKFGYTWRDWRVLSEVARRTQDPEYEKVAGHVADLLTRSASKEQINQSKAPTSELQDRMHRLYGTALIDAKGQAAEIKTEIDSLMALQNADGGWPEFTAKGSPSAVYTSGQMMVSLMQAGVPRDDPRIRKGCEYLLKEQLNFGGWFQTTTSENFRTPMRETRYAVEALAMAFPKKDGTTTGWANRDDRPARLPRTDRLLHTLDDLDNLWEVPKRDQKRFVAALVPLLDHEEPLVRAHAAACLARIGVGCPEAVPPLMKQLDHPNKIVWRSAAWALRHLGNFGTGVDAIKQALHSGDPLVRRGACRVFAYQFFGMDERLDLCARLMELTGDPDLWTRLQALKTLRQWFYRTDNATQQRKIIDTYIARMGVAGEPDSVRANLAQGMYIMLDENLTGGVHLEYNLINMPARIRQHALDNRKEVEKDILLAPVFAALASGNALQREALINSFDGSFFKGRYYARNPRGMIDVGNDREFDFLYEPPMPLLDRTFLAVFKDEHRPAVRRHALQLAAFFHLPAQSTDPEIQRVFLEALRDNDEQVRTAAREIAETDLALAGAEKDAKRIGLLRQLLKDEHLPKAVLVKTIGRNKALLDNPDLLKDLRAMLGGKDSWLVLLPILTHPSFSDAEVLDAVDRGWSAVGEVQNRVALLNLLEARKALIDQARPSEQIVQFLRRGATDPAVPVRERTFNLLAGTKELWPTSIAGRLLYIGLADDSPTIRLQCLKLSAKNSKLWEKEETSEYILKLLVDPDKKIRAEALAAVEQHKLLDKEPRFVRRLKGVMADPEPALRTKAESLLKAHRVDIAKVAADVVVQRPGMLNLSYFRREVNPLFYKPGSDGQACAKCHVNHTILRLAEAPPPGKSLTSDEIMLNYNSMMKIVNLGDPEQSLVLRKPRSPQGQGFESADSPTGLTHVGGPRWDSTQHEAYVKILTWIRSASVAAGKSGQTGWTASVDSYSPAYPPKNALDGDTATFWHTEYVGATPGYPHEFAIDLGKNHTVGGLVYVPRNDGSANGRVKDYEVYVSTDGKEWNKPVAQGTWPNDGTTKYVTIPSVNARYVKLKGLSEVSGLPVMSAAEIVVDIE